jgi:Dolichyl-phosphate-mannose-protein mannosyltransferase
MTAMPQEKSLRRRMTHVNRLDAWLGAVLLSPQRAGAGVAVSIVLFCLLGVLVLLLMKPAETLFMDSTEAYAWGMQFLGGYGRHPPLTGWIARIWYSVFPATHWSSYALSGVMTGISLGSIYLIGRRVVGCRRATLILFAMMFYPLFIGGKADRFNNYQMLLAVLPLTIWLLLRAYDKPNIRSGAALGLSAAAATLTIYSAAFGLIGITLAALLHPDRRKFFTHPAPYAALVAYVLALSPHLIWLFHNDFSSLRWAESFVDRVSHRAHILTYLGQQFGLVAFCLLGAAISLIPWRRRAGPIDAPPPTARLHIIVIATALIGGPALMGLAFNVFLKPDWGNSFFFLVPVGVLSLLPSVLVTRRAVARAVVIAAAFVIALLAGSPLYSWVRYHRELDDGLYRPLPEAAVEITRLWRKRFHSRLPIVASGFEIAAPIVFYSPDHPKMFSDFDPAYAPWIDYPAELKQKGFVGVCFTDDAACKANLKALNPNAEAFELVVRRRMYGIMTPPMKLHLEFTAPEHDAEKRDRFRTGSCSDRESRQIARRWGSLMAWKPSRCED